MARTVLALAMVLVMTGPAAADGCRIAGIADGDTLACDDGRRLRLAGLRVPKPAAWETDASFAATARAGLSALALGRAVVWSVAVPDRHGRLRAQLRRDDGVWLQGEMLRQGLAMVETQRDSRDEAAALLRLEAEARTAGLGLWTSRRYQVQSPESVRTGGWRIVEGRVLQAVKRNGVVYLNFGADWHKDFTVRLTGDGLRACAAAGLDPLALENHRIRVRGWVEWRNGPDIEPDHAEQIEPLD